MVRRSHILPRRLQHLPPARAIRLIKTEARVTHHKLLPRRRTPPTLLLLAKRMKARRSPRNTKADPRRRPTRQTIRRTMHTYRVQDIKHADSAYASLQAETHVPTKPKLFRWATNAEQNSESWLFTPALKPLGGSLTWATSRPDKRLRNTSDLSVVRVFHTKSESWQAK